MLIDHIDHIAKVAGIDHVGLGSDFDGVSGQLPEGLDSPADIPKITAGAARSRLLGRRLPQDSGREPAARLPRSAESQKQLQAEEKERPKIMVTQPFHK